MFRGNLPNEPEMSYSILIAIMKCAIDAPSIKRLSQAGEAPVSATPVQAGTIDYVIRHFVMGLF
jgi:hypothetical protein